MKTTTGRRFKDADARSSNSSFSSNTKGSQQPQSSSKTIGEHRKDPESGEDDEGDPKKVNWSAAEEVNGHWN